MVNKNTKENLIKAYHHVFDGEMGEMVLKDLDRKCHFLGSTFVEGKADLSTFQEGERNVALYIKSRLATNPGDLKNRKHNTQGDNHE